MSQYFTSETDEYIKKFKQANTPAEKHKIFQEGIEKAFRTLIENLIFVYRFYKLDDVETLKDDCLASLYESIEKFDTEKGKKGFSYFNVVAKNWFIQKAREKTKKSKTEREYHVDINKESVKTTPELTYDHHEKDVVEKEFWICLFKQADQWRSKLQKKNEKKVLEAVLFIIQNPELVDNYSKKAVYLYIREMTGLNEKQVTTVLKKLREMYSKWKADYLREGE